MTLSQRMNPFVGPRPFSSRDRDRFYGREREARDLLDQLIIERIVLLYAPSGAGRSSLVQARLIPDLEQNRFYVLPVGRVSFLLPDWQYRQDLPEDFNGYIFSLIQSFELDVPAEDQLSMEQIIQTDLHSYLAHRQAILEEPRRVVMIIDQFEEILTIDPGDVDRKHAFFDQIGAALRNFRWLWALFSIKEDHIAGLDAYARHIPTRFTNTFRLELLSKPDAVEFIQNTVRAVGVDITAEAAQFLVEQLSRYRAGYGDNIQLQSSPYIEPVQLQVVLRELWNNLPENAPEITVENLPQIEDPEHILAHYYAESVARIANQFAMGERTIRAWIDSNLVTAAGTRAVVIHDGTGASGMPNHIVNGLLDSHLLRSEFRHGARWIELTHDRWVRPIVEGNRIWFEANTSLLQIQAQKWNWSARSDDSLLLTGDTLAQAEKWADENPGELTEYEVDFLQACRRQGQVTSAPEIYRLRIIATVTSIISLLSLIALIIVIYLNR